MTTNKNILLIIANGPSALKEKLGDRIDQFNAIGRINNYTTNKRIREMREYDFIVAEIYCVKTPSKPWPQLGFQLAAVHTQREYKGDVKLSYSPMLK